MVKNLSEARVCTTIAAFTLTALDNLLREAFLVETF